MITVSQLLKQKGSDVYSIGPEATVFAALELMAEKDVGALVVVEEDELAGILSERDYARKIILKGRMSKDTPVRDIMSTQVVCVRPNTSIEECMALMTERRIRHLPVLEGDSLAGVISIGDVVKTVISEQKFKIEQLENYIKGG